MKKNYCEKMKKHLNSNFKIFAFKNCFIMLFNCLLYFIFDEISNCLSVDLIIMKKQF